MNSMDTGKTLFEQNKYVLVCDVVSAELCNFFTHVLMRNQHISGPPNDPFVPSCLSVMDHDVMFETLQEKIWPLMEQTTGLELLPTYSYARLYSNGDSLVRHTDRPECEISITLQLGRSHHYAWPIFMAGNRYDLAEGQGVIYRGCDLEHGRDTCDGPTGYYSGQVFMHFVNANGPHADKAFDKYTRERVNRKVTPMMYVKHRSWAMDNK